LRGRISNFETRYRAAPARGSTAIPLSYESPIFMEKAAFSAFHEAALGPGVICCVACAAAEAIVAFGTAMSEGMLASCSNSTARIRWPRMGPPADLPSTPIADLIPTSLHFALFADNCRSSGASARILPQVPRSLAAGIAIGQSGLINYDGEVNADTPPSTSQTGDLEDRHFRAAARSLDIRVL
jgi:hypothetical protein